MFICKSVNCLCTSGYFLENKSFQMNLEGLEVNNYWYIQALLTPILAEWRV